MDQPEGVDDTEGVTPRRRVAIFNSMRGTE